MTEEGVGGPVYRDMHGRFAPIPDPTERTVDMVRREAAYLRDIHDTAMVALTALSAAQDSTRDLMISGVRESLTELRATYESRHADIVKIIDRNSDRLTMLESKDLGHKEYSTTFYAIVGVVLTVAWIGTVVLAWATHH